MVNKITIEKKLIDYDNLEYCEYFKKKKEIFLKSIKSKSPNLKYKRVVTSPIRYPGGKSLGVGHVIELLPNNIKKVISPFFGGGSIEIAMSKYLNLEVLGYEIFDILVNYWKYQIEKPELLYKELKKLNPDKKTYEYVKNKLQDHWEITTQGFEEWLKSSNKFKRYKNLSEKEKIKEWENKKTLDDLKLATYFFFNYNLSYGPGFLGWSSKVYLEKEKYNSIINFVKNFNPKNLNVKCSDFQKIIKNNNSEFLYCDPPYYIGKDSKMFKGIYPMRNIPIHHVNFPHEKLRDLLKNHKGGFILSYNNCETIRDYYKDFEQYFPNWQYTMGQGETRIGKYRKENKTNSHIKESHEIIIYCPQKN